MLKILIINELSVYCNSKIVLLHLFKTLFCLPLQYSSGLLLLASEELLIKKSVHFHIQSSTFSKRTPTPAAPPPLPPHTCHRAHKNKHRMTTIEFIVSPQKPVLKSWSRCAQIKSLKCSQKNNSKTIRINRCVNHFWNLHSNFCFSYFHTDWNVTSHFIGQ